MMIENVLVKKFVFQKYVGKKNYQVKVGLKVFSPKEFGTVNIGSKKLA